MMLSDNTAWRPWEFLRSAVALSSTDLALLLPNNSYVIGVYTPDANDSVTLELSGQIIYLQNAAATTQFFKRPIPLKWFDATSGQALRISYTRTAGKMLLYYVVRDY